MQKQQGFTLVELAVSLVVIGLVLGMVSLPLMRQLIQSGLVALESRLAVLTLAIVPVQTINVASATGLNILTGYTGLVSLGQAAFMGLGAYTVAILDRKSVV